MPCYSSASHLQILQLPPGEPSTEVKHDRCTMMMTACDEERNLILENPFTVIPKYVRKFKSRGRTSTASLNMNYLSVRYAIRKGLLDAVILHDILDVKDHICRFFSVSSSVLDGPMRLGKKSSEWMWWCWKVRKTNTNIRGWNKTLRASGRVWKSYDTIIFIQRLKSYFERRTFMIQVENAEHYSKSEKMTEHRPFAYQLPWMEPVDEHEQLCILQAKQEVEYRFFLLNPTRLFAARKRHLASLFIVCIYFCILRRFCKLQESHTSMCSHQS